jgi:hypothetical protein
MSWPAALHRFECADCGATVWRAVRPAANDESVCLTCNFLRSIADPVEREAIRRRLQGEARQ